MPDTDEELVVDINEPEVKTEGDKAAPQTEPKAKKAQDDPIESLKEQLESLKSQSEAEKTARQQALEEARQAREEAARAKDEIARAKTEVNQSNLSAVETALSAAQSEADSASREQQSAMERGDFAAAAEWGRKVSKAEARVVRLEEGKLDLEARKTETPSEGQEPRKTQPADPFEQALAQASPRTQKWLRQHPDYVTDQALNRKANIAHLKALDEGYIPDSDAYFDFCEKELGLKEKAAPQKATSAKTEIRSKPLPGAPVSREGISMNGALTESQVVLTKGEQQSATDGTIVWNYDDPKGKFKRGEPIGMVEMGRRKLSLQKQGAYDRSYSDS